MDYKKNIRNKLLSKDIKVFVVGMGYVGLPLALICAQNGIQVIGFDNDTSKVDSINYGKSYIKHISSKKISGLVDDKVFSATNDASLVKECDIILLCVPTPLDLHNEPDISYITNSMETILPFLRKGQILSLESTTYPGTTNEILGEYCKEASFEIGVDFFLCYSPEREDPGNKKYSIENTPKVVGGYSEACKELASMFYSIFINKVHQVSSTQVAELAKLLENIYRAVNIGLVNEMKIVTDKLGIDIFEVIEAAATKPFGFSAYYPGPGLGGHCIPIDPFYLTWKAKEYGVTTKFIELAGQINTDMPEWVVNKISSALNIHKKPISTSRILILGVAYKKNVDDLRESPSLKIIKLLTGKGGHVEYSDPYVERISNIEDFPKMHSKEINIHNLRKYDAVVLITDHDDFDYTLIQENSRLIIDTRGVYNIDLDNIIRA
jgi:UDP-N-acetyl-D-glucosamine dehydrogenase